MLKAVRGGTELCWRKEGVVIVRGGGIKASIAT